MKGKKHNAERIIKKLREAVAMLAPGKTPNQLSPACRALAKADRIAESLSLRSAFSAPRSALAAASSL